MCDRDGILDTHDYVFNYANTCGRVTFVLCSPIGSIMPTLVEESPLYCVVMLW